MSEELGRGPVPFDLDREVYNRVVTLAPAGADRENFAEDFIHDAVRYWLIVKSEDGAEESQSRMTKEEERLVRHFLRFLRHGDRDLVSAAASIIESWRKRDRIRP